MDIARIREEYVKASLDEADVAADPIEQFARWFDAALASQVPVPNAMTLATTGLDRSPDARIVLLKGYDQRGFVFFTNYRSSKGLELQADGRAALLFFWAELERQVRISGTVEQVGAAESDEYFASRPLGSRIGAIASPQSEVLSGRKDLENRFAQAEQQHGANPLRPPHWGGYRLKPAQFEYWQGRASRLHDRLRYRLVGGRWIIERLAP